MGVVANYAQGAAPIYLGYMPVLDERGDELDNSQRALFLGVLPTAQRLADRLRDTPSDQWVSLLTETLAGVLRDDTINASLADVRRLQLEVGDLQREIRNLKRKERRA